MVRHVSPTQGDRTSHAPYNFVPLPEKVKTVAPHDLPKHDRYEEGRYTGWIDLTITTETPLYVRCGPSVNDIRQHENSKADHAELTRKHTHRQDFFHHGNPDHPVIPGSSIRGMVRSLVEILSYGKIQHTKSRRLYFRSLGNDSMADLYTGRFQTNAEAGLRGGIFQRTDKGGKIYFCEIARVASEDLAALGQGDPLSE